MPAVVHDRPLALAALLTWLATASLGAFMLSRWVRRGGLRRGGRPGVPPPVIFSHFGLAVTGLMVWAAFVASSLDVLAWVATGLAAAAIGLGICTVMLWTPYPVYPTFTGYPVITGPAGGMLAAPAENAVAARLTDEAMTRALSDEALARHLTEEVLASIPAGPPPPGARRSRGHMLPLIPAAHGMGAVATFLLAVLAAIGPHG
jgi:hypothetical protein